MENKKKHHYLLTAIVAILLGVGGTLAYTAYAAPPAAKDGPIIGMGEFTAVLKDGGTIRVNLSLEAKSDKSQEIIQQKSPFIKDKINSALMSETTKTIKGPEGKEYLRQVLVQTLNQVAQNQIKDVLFLEFIYS